MRPEEVRHCACHVVVLGAHGQAAGRLALPLKPAQYGGNLGWPWMLGC